MSKEELIAALKELLNDDSRDMEANHVDADELLLKFIDDDEIRQAFESIEKYYS